MHPRHLGDLRGLRVLELGSGTGLLGLACAVLGATVICSDLSDVAALLRFNVALNRCRGLLLDVQVVVHRWGEEVTGLGEPDLVAPRLGIQVLDSGGEVMADVVYDLEASRQLLRSLAALAEASRRFLMAFRPRNEEDDFFRELSELFELRALGVSGPYGARCHVARRPPRRWELRTCRCWSWRKGATKSIHDLMC